MLVPVLTIPELAWDAGAYAAIPVAKPALLVYLVRLTRGAGLGLLAAYLIGLLVLKPLLEKTAERRLEVLEVYRHKLMNLYLKMIGMVSYIPIVLFDRANGKRYADAVVQTLDSYLDRLAKKLPDERLVQELEEHELDVTDKVRQNQLVLRMQKLSETLNKCKGYSVLLIPHYLLATMLIKDFQTKADLKLFNLNEFFTVQVPGDSSLSGRTRDIATETKNEVRSIKGLFMLGQA